ncbi:MAG: DNA-3-methyladenine glycosylase I [Anaerolineae bacterium]|nr:DNA-3-methyladenine glycosylase I [Anaerolineae bacterium]
MSNADNVHRCGWASLTEPLYVAYHDNEWGVPNHDEKSLFEFVVLEGMQAGLSWITILKKRDNFRAAFDGFDPQAVAQYDDAKIEALMQDKGIVRNRMKIIAAVQNARSFLQVQQDFGSFDSYIWKFVGGAPIRNQWRTLKDIPAETVESRRMSKDLLKRGFRFVGPTICYAFMQACGMVNDHVVDCFRHEQV